MCHNDEQLPYEVTPSSYQSIKTYFAGCHRPNFLDLGKPEKTAGLLLPVFAVQKADNSPYRPGNEGKTEEVA